MKIIREDIARAPEQARSAGHFVIKDRNGSELYQGVAYSRREFIECLVRQDKSLAGADLRSVNLKNAHLSGADLSGADLTGAELNGAILTGCNAKGATLDKAILSGAELSDAQLQGASLVEVTMVDAQARRANFRGAILDGAKLHRTQFERAVMTFTRMKRVSFRDAKLRDVDFGNARISRCNFNGADLSSTAYLKMRHQPDRTRKAIVVGGSYVNTDMDESKNIGKFKTDRRVTSAASHLFWGTTMLATMGTFAAVSRHIKLPEISWDHVASLAAQAWESPFEFLGTPEGLATSMAVVGIFAARTFVRDMAEDTMKMLLGNGLAKAAQWLRENLNVALNTGRNIKNMVVACGSERSLAPLRKGLEATRKKAWKRGFWSNFSYMLSGNVGAFILCDREHLAMALGALSANRERGYILSQDIILLRKTDKDDPGKEPAAIRFHKDGETTVVWAEGGEPSQSLRYSPEGYLIDRFDWSTRGRHSDPGDVPYSDNVLSALGGFQKAILEQADLPGFRYPEEDHYIHYGRDGSIIVYDSKTRQVDNPLGPALITPDDMGHFYRHGRYLDKEPIPMSKWQQLVHGSMLDAQRSSYAASYARGDRYRENDVGFDCALPEEGAGRVAVSIPGP